MKWKSTNSALNWYQLRVENPSQWTILEPLWYSSFVFATLVHGVIGYKFCWLLPPSRSTSWTWISWYTNWARIRYSLKATIREKVEGVSKQRRKQRREVATCWEPNDFWSKGSLRFSCFYTLSSLLFQSFHFSSWYLDVYFGCLIC